MAQYAIKVLLSALVIVAVTELAKRSSFIGALVASLPLTSLLAFIWLYWDTGDAARVSGLSISIFWLVIPSLALFLMLPLLLRLGWGFWLSLLGATGATVVCYGVMVTVLERLGVSL
jgi:hypothetical protein